MASEIVLTTDGMLINWLKDVGETVKAGEIIAEVEADKATVEVESTVDGVVLSLQAEVGEEISEGSVIALVGAADEAPAEAAPAEESAPEAPAAPAPTVAPNGAAAVTPEGRVKISPVARNVAADRGIDITQIRGTGPGGRITRSDVENFDPSAAPTVPAAAPADAKPIPAAAPVSSGEILSAKVRAMPQPSDDVEIIDTPKMRRTIAAGTLESNQQVPTFYVTTPMALDALMALRKQLNAELEPTGVKISVNDMIVKAAALALRQFPNLNTHYYGDKLVRHKRINIGIAVAPPAGGVIYVVARDADKVSLGTLAEGNRGMVERARDLKLKPEDTRGATFSISNLGPFDVSHFTAIINPPEAAVLAIGSGMKTPVVNDDGSISVSLRMNVTISIDHRVSDGAEAAAYLKLMKDIIENPMRLLV